MLVALVALYALGASFRWHQMCPPAQGALWANSQRRRVAQIVSDVMPDSTCRSVAAANVFNALEERTVTLPVILWCRLALVVELESTQRLWVALLNRIVSRVSPGGMPPRLVMIT